MFGIFAALAEFERELLRERTVAGLKARQVGGRNGGKFQDGADDATVSSCGFGKSCLACFRSLRCMSFMSKGKLLNRFVFLPGSLKK